MHANKTALALSLTVLALSVTTVACDGSAVGEGTLGVEIWGEDYIESGIPAGELADGWAITFDRFLINVGAISVAEEGADPAVTEPGFRVFDLTATTGPEQIVAVTAPAGTYDHTVYTVAPASSASGAGNAADADVQLVADGGFAVYVEGAATDGAETVTFAWGFSRTTVYDPCHSIAVLGDGGSASVQLTIHGDHLFYDDAVSEEPELRFADIALADADADGEVTRAELEAYDITVLPDYGVGSLDIDNLWGFIEHMTTTLGHIDGEGHCGS